MRKFEVCRGFENSGVQLPKRATKFSAGYDIYSNENCVIKPSEVYLVATGVKVKMANDEVLKIYSRSSLGVKKRLALVNSVGIIDSDYYGNKENDGHIRIALYNFSPNSVEIFKGERIAQGLFSKYLICDDDSASKVRTGGFGSTNEKKFS